MTVRASGNSSRVPAIVAQSFAGWVLSSTGAAGDASYTTLASITLPGGTMGSNSKIVVVADWDLPNSASTKTMAMDFGGSNISSLGLTTGNVTVKTVTEVQNKNSLSSQTTFNSINYGLGATNARTSTSVDTANDVTIVFKAKWGGATASETITLVGYSIWHYPGS